jgi:hypothetical protein
LAVEMNSLDRRVQARSVAMDRLATLTTWIAAGSLAAVGVFAAVAAATIPGKASPSQGASAAPSAPATSTQTSSSGFAPRHHHDTPSVSSSSGPPMAVTGSSH